MATTSLNTFKTCHPFPSTISSPAKPLKLKPSSFPPRALDPSQSDDPPPSPNAKQARDAQPAASESDSSFENRLSQVRLKYRSGTGKKAEQRKARRSPTGSSSRKAKDAVMLPPVPLREPVSGAAGVKVDFGFCPYSEWLNGRLAALGLAAMLLVELGSGRGLLSYHTPPIIFIQIYTIAAASAVFIKYEKERVSVWPERPSVPPSSASGE